MGSALVLRDLTIDTVQAVRLDMIHPVPTGKLDDLAARCDLEMLEL